MQPQDQPLGALQQGVVQFAGDAFAFTVTLFQTRAQACGHLPGTHAPGDAERQQQRQRAAGLELPGLDEGRLDDEVQGVAARIPQAVVVGGRNTEAVTPGRKVGIEGLVAVAGVLPTCIHPFQPVAEPHALRAGKADRVVADAQTVGPFGQVQAVLTRVRPVVGDHVGDEDLRRGGVAVGLLGIEPGQALVGGEPEQAIGRGDRGRHRAGLLGDAGQAIHDVVQAQRGADHAGAQAAQQCLPADLHDAAIAVQPEGVVTVAHDAGDALQHRIGLIGHLLEAAIAAEHCQPAFASHQGEGRAVPNGGDRADRQAVVGGVVPHLPAAQHAELTCDAAYPQRAVRRGEQDRTGLVQQAGNRLPAMTIPALRAAGIGTRPGRVLGIDGKRADGSGAHVLR